jgi:hypothetical protein
MPDFPVRDDIAKKRFLFLGYDTVSDIYDNFFISTLALVIMLSVWECKLQKKIPVSEKIANDVFFHVENIRRASSAIRPYMTLNLHICRNWSAEVSRRGYG